MKITNVEYRELVSHNYDNTTLGAVGLVEEGEAPEEALATLKAWVDAQRQAIIGVTSRVEERRAALWAIEQDLAEKAELQRIAQRKWEAAQKFLAAHGIDVQQAAISLNDLPF